MSSAQAVTRSRGAREPHSIIRFIGGGLTLKITRKKKCCNVNKQGDEKGDDFEHILSSFTLYRVYEQVLDRVLGIIPKLIKVR